MFVRLYQTTLYLLPLQTLTLPYKKNLLSWLDGECVFGHFDRGHHSIHMIFVAWEVYIYLPLWYLHADWLSPHCLPTNKVSVLVQVWLTIYLTIYKYRNNWRKEKRDAWKQWCSLKFLKTTKINHSNNFFLTFF